MRYGVADGLRWSDWIYTATSLVCGVATFGDPAVGWTKACECRPGAPDEATENVSPVVSSAAEDDNRFWVDVTDGMVRVGRGYSASRRTLITWQVTWLGLLGPGFQLQRTETPGAGRTLLLLRPSFDPGAAPADSYLTAQMATAMVMLSPVSTGHMI